MDPGGALIPSRSGRPPAAGIAAVSLLAGLAAFVVGALVESRFVRLLARDPQELSWISDVVLALALTLVTYLWLHLRASRVRLSRLEREQIGLDAQLRLAGEIQRSLLPRVPERTPGFAWAAAMEPAGRIGGDFYDLVEPAPGTLLLVVGDISGKGVPAALLLSSSRTLFRTIARVTRAPREVAARLSSGLYEETAGAMYMTCLVALFEAAPARLTFTNAGHPPGLLVRDGVVRALDVGGPPAGLLPVAAYEQAELPLRAGDVGLIVTDGVTEALERDGPTLPDLALELLRAQLDGPAGLRDAVMARARAGHGPVGVEDWQDDRTVVTFRVDGA